MSLEAGVFLIDKPAGPTSFRMVQRVRRLLKIKKVGHTGTLDPFASGLLIVCAGRPATRLTPQLMAGDKLYEATLRLGVETDTQDLEGQVISERPAPALDLAAAQSVLAGFLGERMQIPPAFSALKHQGRPLYQYARQGVLIEKEARRVRIEELVATFVKGERLGIRVRCGKGTYIRSLAADIGRALGCWAHLIELRRLENGPFSVAAAVSGHLLEGDEESARAVLLAGGLTLDGLAAWMAAAPGFSPGCVDAGLPAMES